MKKILIPMVVLAACVQVAQAYPNVDVTTGGMPFRLMQQQQFQKMELNDFKKFKDADDFDVEKRNDDASKIKQEYEIKNLKRPAKIMLGQPKDVPESSEMELIEEDGKIRIKQMN